MKLIKKVKYFPSGSNCIWLNRSITTPGDAREFFEIREVKE